MCIYNLGGDVPRRRRDRMVGAGGIAHLDPAVPTSRAARHPAATGVPACRVVRSSGSAMPYSFASGCSTSPSHEPTRPASSRPSRAARRFPPTSNLNYVPGQTIAASVLVPPGPTGACACSCPARPTSSSTCSAASPRPARRPSRRWAVEPLRAPVGLHAARRPLRRHQPLPLRRLHLGSGAGSARPAGAGCGSRSTCTAAPAPPRRRVGLRLLRLRRGRVPASRGRPRAAPTPAGPTPCTRRSRGSTSGPGHPRRPPACSAPVRQPGRPHQPRRHVPGRRAHAQRHDGVRRAGAACARRPSTGPGSWPRPCLRCRASPRYGQSVSPSRLDPYGGVE